MTSTTLAVWVVEIAAKHPEAKETLRCEAEYVLWNDETDTFHMVICFGDDLKQAQECEKYWRSKNRFGATPRFIARTWNLVDESQEYKEMVRYGS